MPAKTPVRILVGTRKGAFLFSSKDRKKWDIAGPCFSGQEVHRVAQDPRDPKRHYAAVTTPGLARTSTPAPTTARSGNLPKRDSKSKG